MAGGLGGARPGHCHHRRAWPGALDRGFNMHRRGIGGEDIPAGSRVVDIFALRQLIKVKGGIDAGVGELLGIVTAAALRESQRLGKGPERG